MAKVRVYELAKELGVESKVIMTKLQEMGEFVRSASSTVEPPVVRKLRSELPADGAAPAAKKAAPKKAAPRPAAPAAGAAFAVRTRRRRTARAGRWIHLPAMRRSRRRRSANRDARPSARARGPGRERRAPVPFRAPSTC